MKKTIQITAIVPAFNEELAIADVVRSLRKELSSFVENYEILVVDDGSTDKTAELARSEGATVINHPINRGYGKSLMTGISNARYEWILTTDGDGSYPAHSFSKLLAYVPEFDMVIGSRTGTHFWGTPLKAFLRWIYLSISRYIVGEKIPDVNSGFRIIRKSTFQSSVPILCMGYSFSTTLTLSFIRGGQFVQSVPIEYIARKGHSKVKPLRDILRTLQLMTQIIIFYNPLKLAVSIALLPLIFCGILTWEYVLHPLPQFLIGALLSFYCAIGIFLAGCILDALRMHKK